MGCKMDGQDRVGWTEVLSASEMLNSQRSFLACIYHHVLSGSKRKLVGGFEEDL